MPEDKTGLNARFAFLSIPVKQEERVLHRHTNLFNDD